MGGFGSGRWGWHTPSDLVENCRRIGLTALGADGAFRSGAAGALHWRNRDGTVVASVGYAVADAGGPVLRLCYRWTPARGEPREVDLPIRLVRLPAPRGGSRWAGVCPLAVNGVACGRRAVTLYLPPGGVYFGCRHCHRLAYASSRDHDPRADALRRDPAALARLLGNPRGAPISMLGAVLSALRREQAAEDRVQKAAERRARRRERRRARRAGNEPTTGGRTDDDGNES